MDVQRHNWHRPPERVVVVFSKKTTGINQTCGRGATSFEFPTPMTRLSTGIRRGDPDLINSRPTT